MVNALTSMLCVLVMISMLCIGSMIGFVPFIAGIIWYAVRFGFDMGTEVPSAVWTAVKAEASQPSDKGDTK